LVWEIVRQILQGRVSTYGRIAAFLPPPKGISERAYEVRGARMVGGAMAACPADVPWQRVINAQGKVSLRSGGGGEGQRAILESEGVEGLNLMKRIASTWLVSCGKDHPRNGYWNMDC
jgi:methylated-DNA-protein-cysteine methyltransferase-like protein